MQLSFVTLYQIELNERKQCKLRSKTLKQTSISSEHERSTKTKIKKQSVFLQEANNKSKFCNSNPRNYTDQQEIKSLISNNFPKELQNKQIDKTSKYMNKSLPNFFQATNILLNRKQRTNLTILKNSTKSSKREDNVKDLYKVTDSRPNKFSNKSKENIGNSGISTSSASHSNKDHLKKHFCLTLPQAKQLGSRSKNDNHAEHICLNRPKATPTRFHLKNDQSDSRINPNLLKSRLLGSRHKHGNSKSHISSSSLKDAPRRRQVLTLSPGRDTDKLWSPLPTPHYLQKKREKHKSTISVPDTSGTLKTGHRSENEASKSSATESNTKSLQQLECIKMSNDTRVRSINKRTKLSSRHYEPKIDSNNSTLENIRIKELFG